MRKHALTGVAALAIGLGFFTAPAAQADGSASLEVYAVGTAQNGAAPVWLGGQCSSGASRATLHFLAGEFPGLEFAHPVEVASPSPGTQSPEVPSEAGNDDPDNTVDVTLNSDGSFEYIYDTSGVQQVIANCIYPDGNVASTSTEVNADLPTKPALSASSNEQQEFYPGGTIELSLRGFAAGQSAEAYMHSKPMFFWDGNTGSGNIDVRTKIPENATPGKHHLTIRARNGQRAIFAFLLRNKPAGDSGGSTAGPVQPRGDKPAQQREGREKTVAHKQQGKQQSTGGRQVSQRLPAVMPKLPKTGF